jgi:hypothetical protein
MRYRKYAVQFWQMGYRLFHGNFVRFIPCIRNVDQVLDGTSEKGLFDPLKSNINFAVPSKNSLTKKIVNQTLSPNIQFY